MKRKERKLTVENVDGIMLVRFSGPDILTEIDVEAVSREFRELAAVRNARVVLSFEGVEHLSSAALRELLMFHRALDAGGGRLHLSNISPDVSEVFRITRLDEFFEIYPGEPDAIASLRD